jgi:type IV pilus assembly protein PilX
MKPTYYRRNESGAVLIVSLIMLVVISIVGFSTVKLSVMEERMAGNLMDSERAFQAAEAALRAGEAAAQAAYPDTDNIPDGAVTLAGPNGETFNAQYQVEEVISYEVSLKAGEPVDTSGTIVRVTAQANGLTGVRAISLESTYQVTE